ncbi:hypothetical protein L7F22_019795 [Adiantum nelumboides]|nr:hypothetical protein [Adiantum nelumboides]
MKDAANMTSNDEGLARELNKRLNLDLSASSTPSSSNSIISDNVAEEIVNVNEIGQSGAETEQSTNKDEELARFRNAWKEEVLGRKQGTTSNEPVNGSRNNESNRQRDTYHPLNQTDWIQEQYEDRLHEEVTSEIEEKDDLTVLIESLAAADDVDRDLSLVRFEPEDEEEPVYLSKLPDEILLLILSFVAEPRGRRGAEIPRPQTIPAPVQKSGGGIKPATEKHNKSVHNEDQHHAEIEAAAAEIKNAEEHNGDSTSDPTRATSFKPLTRKGPTGVGVILAGPDYMSIERLARTCWKFRQLTRAWSVWKMIVYETFYPPQIPQRISINTLLTEKHRNDWRTLFIDQPRVRMNGAYIASYQYTRPGVHEENVWVRVIHVVKFYRSIRFLPDGRVLSFTTTDPPQDTVRKMDPAFYAKGFATGRWTMHPDGLADDEILGRPKGAKIVIDDLNDKTLSRYNFRLILKLDGRNRGKWDRMEMLEYESINLVSGEICPLPMNHKKPFHFSPVRSYGI